MNASSLRWLAIGTLFVATAALSHPYTIRVPRPLTKAQYDQWLMGQAAYNESESRRGFGILMELLDVLFWRQPPVQAALATKAAPEPGTPVALGYTFNAPCTGARAPVGTPDGRFLYVANGDICAYSLDAETRVANPIPGMPYRAGNFARSITLDRSGAYLYAASQDSGDVSGFAIDEATGALTPVPGSPFTAGSEPFAVVTDGSGRFVYVANSISKNVSGYRIDMQTGALSPLPGSPFAAPERPWAIAADPTGKYVYVAAVGLQAYRIDQTSGALSPIGSPLSTGNFIAKGIAVDPTGRFVYATWGFGEQSGVSAYAIGPGGALTPAGTRQPTGDNPLAVIVHPSGAHVYTANLLAGNLSGFHADPGTGALTPIAGSPFAIGGNPTGLHVTGNLLPDVYADVGVRVGRPIGAMGGQPPYAYELIAGGLPPGLALDPVTGMVTGTLGAAGNFAFTIRATDSVGASTSADYTFEVRAASTGTATAVEYYNDALGHYFITHIVDEIAKLDGGITKGWTRTGKSMPVYTAAQTSTSPVCRYYLPPGFGDSHFYGRGTVECLATGQQNPSFFLEDAAFMHMVLPDAGVCPANTINVYRVFNHRSDVNHRYMTDKATRDEMVAKGWVAEGDGPDLVVMCGPR